MAKSQAMMHVFEVVEGAVGSKAAWAWLEGASGGREHWVRTGVEVGPMCCEHWTELLEQRCGYWEQDPGKGLQDRKWYPGVGEWGVGKLARSRNDAGELVNSSDSLTIGTTNKGRPTSQSSSGQILFADTGATGKENISTLLVRMWQED